ncbi:hypothetical protein CJI97_000996 [Candidozyma auris]|nr:hypothetical protein CJI97_000996 [[Candida] auris]
MRELFQITSKNRRPLIILVATLAVINLVYYLCFSSVDLVNGPALYSGVGVWKFATDNARYYVVDEAFVATSNELRRIAKFSEDVPISKEELTSALTSKLEKDGGEFLKQIYQEVSDKYSDEYKTILMADLKKQMTKDYTYLFYQTLQKSYTLLAELKARYLESHEEELKKVLVGEFLKNGEDTKNAIEEGKKLGFDREAYFRYLFGDVLVKYGPKLAMLQDSEIGEPINGNSFREVIGSFYTKKWLTKNRVKLNDLQMEEIQTNHDHVVRELRSVPQPPAELYNGDGIAISANGIHLPGALMLAGQLRQVGSQLPIEIILDTENDYHKQACEEVAPKLDAKCVVTERVLGKSTFDLLGKDPFQLKAVSLLMSSFDNTIALDADNFVLKNVDFLLSSKPYMETRFILWPDVWHKGTSPLYYDIARFTIGEPVKRQGLENSQPFNEYITKDIDKEIYFHDLDGTPPGRGVESGQLVFSKKEHFRSLALAAYYNIHREFYYPLLYQGVHGSGDRETFVPALHVMNEPYYLCEYQVEFMGVWRPRPTEPEEKYFDETTLIQRDPQESKEFFAKWRSWLRSQSLDQRLYMFQENDYTKELYTRFASENKDLATPSALFLHVHMPKMNPLYNELSAKNKYDYKGRYLRKIGEYNEAVGDSDYELRIHTLSQWLVCEELTDTSFWNRYEVDRSKLCEKITKYVKILKEDTNDASAAELKKLDGKTDITN